MPPDRIGFTALQPKCPANIKSDAPTLPTLAHKPPHVNQINPLLSAGPRGGRPKRETAFGPWRKKVDSRLSIFQ